jgi:hypothetical protein
VREQRHLVAARRETAHEQVDHALDAAVQPWRYWEIRVGGDGNAHERG